MPYLDFFVDHKNFLRMSLGADDGNHWIENLSPNGTRLNASMVEGRIMLQPKDRVYIADYAMIYHPGAPPSLNSEEEETLFPEG